jgi:hypothetical protein
MEDAYITALEKRVEALEKEIAELKGQVSERHYPRTVCTNKFESIDEFASLVLEKLKEHNVAITKITHS